MNKLVGVSLALFLFITFAKAEDKPSMFHLSLEYDVRGDEVIALLSIEPFGGEVKAPTASLTISTSGSAGSTGSSVPATVWYSPKDHPYWWSSLVVGALYAVYENNSGFRHGDHKGDDAPLVPVAQDTAAKTTPAQLVATGGGEIITHQTSCPDIIIAKGVGSKVICDEFPPSEN